jgi:hypothetical protein
MAKKEKEKEVVEDDLISSLREQLGASEKGKEEKFLSTRKHSFGLRNF